MANSDNNRKISLLYITGCGRSGSTLMERVLNEIPGFFAAGELGRGLWHRACLFEKDTARCLCGQKIGECPVWGSIINEAAFKEIDEKSFRAAQEKYHKQNITTFLKLSLKKKQELPADLKQYLDSLQLLYELITKNRNCQVITDSSHLPLYGYYLSLMPAIDLYVVHLVRDPRGFTRSCSTVKLTPKGVPWSPKRSSFLCALSWLKRNVLVEFLALGQKKYLRVHYEDFVENPSRVIKEIGDMLGMELNPSSFIHEKTVQLGEHHIIDGNIDAMTKQEEIVLKLDKRWKRDMKWWNIVLVTLITWPLLLKYFIVDKLIKKKRKGI